MRLCEDAVREHFTSFSQNERNEVKRSANLPCGLPTKFLFVRLSNKPYSRTPHPVLTKRAERSEAWREFAVGLPHYDFSVNVTIALGESRPSELMHHTSS